MKRLLTAAALAAGLSAPAFAQEISIATIGPMTGQYASFGSQMKAGAEQAVADINAAGGVLGKKLKLIIEDDACDPKQAVAAAGKLSAAKVALVAGHFCSGSSIPASKVYAEEGVVQLLFFEGEPCATSYAHREGKYQNQGHEVTLPKV